MRDPITPLSDSQRESIEEAVLRYEQSMTPAGASYLAARGITKEIAEDFRLGAVCDPAPGHNRYVGWLAIPYLGKGRAPKTVRFRCLQDHVHRDFGHGKYLTLPGDPARVYNVRSIHEAGDEIHVAEGEFDAMILNKVGLPAVAIPGAKAWERHHRRMLAGFSRVWVWGDPDDAGADFTNAVSRSLKQAKGVRLRSGDVTENYLEGGRERLLSLIEGSA